MVSVEVCQTNAALKIETKKNKKSKALVEPNQFVLSFFFTGAVLAVTLDSTVKFLVANAG